MLKIYTFYNRNTGSYRKVMAFKFHDAMNKCKSSNGWEMVSFKNAQ